MPHAHSVGRSPRMPAARERARLSRAGHRWLDTWMRAGQFGRGIVYLIPGVFALRLAVGAGGTTIGQTRALEMIGRQPFGRAMLVVVTIGLAGYTLWGL